MNALADAGKAAWEWYTSQPEEVKKELPPVYTPQQAQVILLKRLQGQEPKRPLTPDEQILAATQKSRLGGAGQPNYRGGPNYNIGTAGQSSSLPLTNSKTINC